MSIEDFNKDKSLFKLSDDEKQYYNELTELEIIQLAFSDTSLLNNLYVKYLIKEQYHKQQNIKTIKLIKLFKKSIIL